VHCVASPSVFPSVTCVPVSRKRQDIERPTASKVGGVTPGDSWGQKVRASQGHCLCRLDSISHIAAVLAEQIDLVNGRASSTGKCVRLSGDVPVNLRFPWSY